MPWSSDDMARKGAKNPAGAAAMANTIRMALALTSERVKQWPDPWIWALWSKRSPLRAQRSR